MVRAYWLVVVLLAFGMARLSAGEPTAPRGQGRKVPLTMEDIATRLGAESALTDEQKPKVQAVNDEFTKKMEEANKKPGVAAAQEELTKARASGDFNQMRAAQTKLTEAMGFNAYDEYKKALTPILTQAQVDKLFPARRQGGRGGTKGGGGGQ